MTTVLLTRPAPASRALADRLRGEGYRTVIEPLLTIVSLGAPRPDLTSIASVMITSGNAVSALDGRRAELAALFDLPCFAIGGKTAHEARGAGFRHVVEGEAGGAALFEQAARVLPSGKSILHICGEHREIETQRAIDASAAGVVSWVVYRADASSALSRGTIAQLSMGQIDAVTSFSLRTSDLLAQLLRQHALEACCQSLTAIGLSRAVLEPLHCFRWADCVAAADPSEEGVIDCLKLTNPPA